MSRAVALEKDFISVTRRCFCFPAGRGHAKKAGGSRPLAPSDEGRPSRFFLMSHLRRLSCYGAVLLFFGVYYFWQCARDDDPCRIWNIFANAPDRLGAYGDLTNGFLRGTLSIPLVPDPRLAKVKNPYDPSIRGPEIPFAWDYAYYHGKYYVYFGAAPVILIDLPWHFFFGYVPSQHVTVYLLAMANLVVFAVLLHMLGVYFFPRVPVSFQCLLLVFYGFGNLLPFLLSRTAMYETAISGGALFALLFFVLILFCICHENRRILGLALASCAAGLAVGCRPTTVILFGFLAFFWAWRHGRRPFTAAAGKEFVAIAIPAALSFAALFTYNYERFGSIFQFGNKYLLNWGDVWFKPNFELRNIPDSLWSYFIQPWHTTVEFPCVGLGCDLRIPGIFLPEREREPTSGVFLACPLALTAGAWWWYVRRMAWPERGAAQLFGGMVSAWAVCYALFISAFFFLTCRYQIELQMPVLLLTALTLLARRNEGPFRTWEWVCFILLFQVSCYIGFAFGLIGANDFLHHYLHPGS